ncbi:MAG: hypothetical protein RSC57_00905 [Bacilli bacterium]
MKLRMERYDETPSVDNTSSRILKNEEMYKSLDEVSLSKIKANDNIKVLESSSKEINIDKIKKYILNNSLEKPVKHTILSPDDIKLASNTMEETKEKIYDINSVLEKARENRSTDYNEERYKKINNIDYDLISKIKCPPLTSEEEVSSEELNTGERTLVDLINTISIKKEETSILSELMASNNEEKVLPIDLEIEKESLASKEPLIKKIEPIQKPSKDDNIDKIDKSFYTSSLSFNKKDFEGFEELEKNVKKNNVFVTLLILFIIVIVAGTLFVIANYVLHLNLF